MDAGRDKAAQGRFPALLHRTGRRGSGDGAGPHAALVEAVCRAPWADGPPVCSPQLHASRSSSRSSPCATRSFPRRMATTSSTRPPRRVSALAETRRAGPHPGRREPPGPLAPARGRHGERQSCGGASMGRPEPPSSPPPSVQGCSCCVRGLPCPGAEARGPEGLRHWDVLGAASRGREDPG